MRAPWQDVGLDILEGKNSGSRYPFFTFSVLNLFFGLISTNKELSQTVPMKMEHQLIMNGNWNGNRNQETMVLGLFSDFQIQKNLQ